MFDPGERVVSGYHVMDMLMPVKYSSTTLCAHSTVNEREVRVFAKVQVQCALLFYDKLSPDDNLSVSSE
jgi:hypothetical protein